MLKFKEIKVGSNCNVTQEACDKMMEEMKLNKQKGLIEELKAIQNIEEMVKLDPNNQDLVGILKRRKEAYDEHNNL